MLKVVIVRAASCLFQDRVVNLDGTENTEATEDVTVVSWENMEATKFEIVIVIKEDDDLGNCINISDKEDMEQPKSISSHGRV
ncbi:hypothetical protein CHS0354_017666 [Potamilus streckersoni]|uniref:Uncharacterized protein n=1 Tax=Potamilus streckersoni TaxID=2493646 RepID=A0AAE0VQW4_9BIVA|nr:hypothetical protein CHS0354_017666 [Potamilus streckersoni]